MLTRAYTLSDYVIREDKPIHMQDNYYLSVVSSLSELYCRQTKVKNYNLLLGFVQKWGDVIAGSTKVNSSKTSLVILIELMFFLPVTHN